MKVQVTPEIRETTITVLFEMTVPEAEALAAMFQLVQSVDPDLDTQMMGAFQALADGIALAGGSVDKFINNTQPTVFLPKVVSG